MTEPTPEERKAFALGMWSACVAICIGGIIGAIIRVAIL